MRESVTSALEVYSEDSWSDIGGKDYTLGLDSEFGNLAKMDYVGIPTNDSAWRFDKFTKDQYNAILAKIKNGEVTINNSVTEAPKTSKISVTWTSSFAGAEN